MDRSFEIEPIAQVQAATFIGDQNATVARHLCRLGAHLATVVIRYSDIEITEWRFSGRAADLGLLLHTLDHFMRQIATVKLGDRAHDAVQQHAGGRLVDVLCR